MIIEVNNLEQMKKILSKIDNRKYECYLVPLQYMYFRPNVTTKGRDTYKFNSVSLENLQVIKTIWGENNIIVVNCIYPEDKIQ